MAEPIQTQLLLSVDKLFSTVLEDLTQGYTTAINIDVNQLPTDVCIYSKVRHKERTLGWTPWSPVMTFYIEVPSTWLTLWTSDTVKGYLRNIAANATEIVSTGYLYDEDQAIYRACILKLDKAGRVKWLRVLDIASTDGGVGNRYRRLYLCCD